MKKAIWILSIALFISLLVIAFLLWWHRLATSKIIQENNIILQNKEKLLTERENTINNLLENPITKETIKYLSSAKKDEIILNQQDIIKADTIIIDNLYDRLNKTNEALKATFSFQHSLSLFALAGIDKTITPDIYVGVMYRRYFTNCKLIEPFIGGGIAVKIYEDIGGAGLFEVGFKFGKNK